VRDPTLDARMLPIAIVLLWCALNGVLLLDLQAESSHPALFVIIW
jgi:hypothetical protein